MTLPGGGKSGGARVIYYHLRDAAQIRLLLAYGKSEQADLTVEQCKSLRKIIETWE